MLHAVIVKYDKSTTIHKILQKAHMQSAPLALLMYLVVSYTD